MPCTLVSAPARPMPCPGKPRAAGWRAAGRPGGKAARSKASPNGKQWQAGPPRPPAADTSA
eukprot:8888093-Pyramimonas_sp.AAC.1